MANASDKTEIRPNKNAINNDSWNVPAQPNLGSQSFSSTIIYPSYRAIGKRKVKSDTDVNLIY